jgi:peroxiredoxin
MSKSNAFFSRTGKYSFIVFSFIIIALVAMEFWQRNTPTPAPDAVFTTIQGEKIVLKNLRGKPVLVTFWATDCPSCVKEVNDFIELYQQFHAQGLEIIAVAMYYDPPNHVVEMTQAKQIPYHVALDLQAKHAYDFGQIQLTPTTLLINPQGLIVLRKTGRFELADMQQRIQQLL